MADLYAFKPGRRVYEVNTRIAVRRVREMIDQGVADGAFRDVNAAFVGEVVAATIVRIHHGDIATACNFTDARRLRRTRASHPARRGPLAAPRHGPGRIVTLELGQERSPLFMN